MFRAVSLALLAAAAPACGDDGPTEVLPDVDNGACGDQLRFTGEYVDWDSNATFCGIFGATFQVEGGGPMDTTAPNGRFDFCIPNRDATNVVITPPAQASACNGSSELYALPGIAVARRDSLSVAMWSGRAFTTARQAVDSAKAQVVVHVAGTPRAVTLGAAHGPAQAFDGTAWAAGDTGRDVFFPDVDPAGGATTLDVPGASVVGAGEIPLVPGTLTNVTIFVR